MKNLFFISLSMLFLFACKTEDQKDDTNTNVKEETLTSAGYSLNIENSVVNWKGTMIGVYSHEGTMNFTDGIITVENGKVAAGSFTTDMNSMIATDDEANYVNAPREKLIAHLQNDDFFATDKFPTSKFVIKRSEGNKIIGDMTIRGITHEESVTDVRITEGNGVLKAEGNLVFDRQKYDVAYKSSMKDMVLSDDIELNILIEGTLK